jgi:Txe/YoeB family toxin of Txe-Axe toxin-antitoxin module
MAKKMAERKIVTTINNSLNEAKKDPFSIK